MTLAKLFMNGRSQAVVNLGQSLGPMDTQIASISLAHGLTLGTTHEKEFARVPHLKIENWNSGQA